MTITTLLTYSKAYCDLSAHATSVQSVGVCAHATHAKLGVVMVVRLLQLQPTLHQPKRTTLTLALILALTISLSLTLTSP